jgi:hypothetical protein
MTAGNPRVPSLLGCGGLFLLFLGALGTTLLAAAVPFWSALTEAGLHIDEEVYPIGEVWWLVGPLGVVSLVGVYRLMKGHRDWLGAAAAGGWMVVGAWYAATTAQYGMLGLTALLTFALVTGTWRDRKATARSS